MNQSIVRDPAALQRFLASQGHHGDSIVAHINPQEALALKLAGGAGTINPNTGLPQFFPSTGIASPGGSTPGMGAPSANMGVSGMAPPSMGRGFGFASPAAAPLGGTPSAGMTPAGPPTPGMQGFASPAAKAAAAVPFGAAPAGGPMGMTPGSGAMGIPGMGAGSPNIGGYGAPGGMAPGGVPMPRMPLSGTGFGLASMGIGRPLNAPPMGMGQSQGYPGTYQGPQNPDWMRLANQSILMNAGKT